MNKDVEDVISQTGGVPFGVNEWGRAQYTGALNLFNALEVLSKKEGKEEAFKKLHLHASHKGVVPVKTAWVQFRKDMIDHAREMDFEEDEMDALASWFNKTPASVGAMFVFCREHSWDLWTTAPYIAGLIFRNLATVAEQSQNYEAGLCCWLLWNEGVITDSPEKVFGGFDI